MQETESIDEYILQHIDPESDYLKSLYRDTHVKLLRPRMASGHLQGRLLKMFVEMIQPRQILEIGTYSGYSALCLAEGLAEAVKHAAIKDASMLHELKGLGPELSIGFSLNTIARLPDLIARNVAIKARIVENDELETLDIRALLNFGHTIGHGIEAAVPYGTILHGEAVALGMRAALFLSERKAGLSSSDANKILRTLQALELPLVLPDGIDTATVLQKTASDKKFRAGTIRFVLLSKAGEAGISTNITREDMAEAIEELRRPLD